tara:strand:- start:2529 stop:4850 length:2322 start_codon:yes stop_codon:yes gene_type:complete
MYLKNLYKFFLILSFILVICLPLFIEFKNKNIVNKKKGNLYKKELTDSILPLCNYLENKNDFSNKKINQIELEIPESRRWYKNMILAAISNSGGIIRDRYKKKFNGFIFLKEDEIVYCKIPIKVRISGDSKEHIIIDRDEIYSSIDIRLLEDNLNGIIKFKLFIPETRRGNSEIITATLLEELGFLSPRTKNIKVRINNKNLDMIFQEKAAKEMFENKRIRESAIVETNESLLWELRTKGLGRSFNSLLFPKILNSNWLSKSEINKKVSMDALHILSNAIHESWDNKIEEENSYSDLILSNYNHSNEIKLSSFRIYVIAMGAFHSLINHNRRFYYDAFNNSLLPIYYDGNSKVINYSKLEFKNDLKQINSYNMLREISIQDINNALNQLSLLKVNRLKFLLDSRGVFLSEKEIDIILNNISNNIEILKNNLTKLDYQNINWGRDPLKKFVDINNNYGIAFSEDGQLFNMCNMKTSSCKFVNLNSKDSENILSDKLNFEKINYFYYGKNYDFFRKNKLIAYNKKGTLRSIKDQINIETTGKTIYKFNKEKKVINIKTFHPLDKFTFYESYLNGWTINLDAANHYKDKKILENRYDKSLLTGILNIQDSILNAVDINIIGGKAEDSLNIVRSKGNINSIKVSNSYQDAVDLDFSNLKISKIDIKNAGNDCIDLSLGIYKIKEIKGFNCFDKGISVGEKATVFIDDIFVDSSNINVVSKDSSKLYIQKANFKNYSICAAAYRKKQEFGGGFIELPIKTCTKEKLIIQDGSILKLRR